MANQKGMGATKDAGSQFQRIGILGSGDVGKQLGRGFAKHGFEVKVGSRTPSKLEDWRKEVGHKVSIGTFGEAAAFGEVLILATHGDGTESAIDQAGVENFAGKLVIDATNPLDFSKGMPPALLWGTTDSQGERVQRKLPSSHVVKCFNTVGNVKMIEPKFEGGPVPMLICGNDAGAKQKTTDLLRAVGWPGSLDVGNIDGARWLEAMVPLWVRVGMALNKWDHMFKVVS